MSPVRTEESRHCKYRDERARGARTHSSEGLALDSMSSRKNSFPDFTISRFTEIQQRASIAAPSIAGCDERMASYVSITPAAGTALSRAMRRLFTGLRPS